MSSLNSAEDIINELKDSPYSALFLYKLYTKGIDFKLPYFINRVKEVNYLREKGLIEFISGDAKHQHYKPTKFTEKGLEIYKELEKEGFFTIFEDIPLNSKNAFKSKYYQKLDKLKDKIKHPESEIYKILIEKFPGLDKWWKPGSIKLNIKGIEPLEITEDNEILKFTLEFNCEICKKLINTSIQITYDIEDIDRSPREVRCPFCNTLYYLCPLLGCFYSI